LYRGLMPKNSLIMQTSSSEGNITTSSTTALNNRSFQKEDSVQLLSQGAEEINKELYEAAEIGDSTGVQSALSQGANVNYHNPKEFGTSSLHVAARGGYHDVVQILLSAGANVNLINRAEETALIEAARGGNCDVVELLLKKGADPSHSNGEGYTALIEAALGGHYDIVQLLLNNGADRSTATYRGDTALVLAAEEGYDNIVQLLSEEADPNTSVNNKKLYEAAKRGDSTGVQSALSQGANVNYQNPKEFGATSLHVAAGGGYHDVVQILLSARAKTYLRDTDGDTALIKAARKGNCDVVELLLKKGVRLLPLNNDRNTALVIAAERGHYDIVQLLLNNGADRSTANYSGETALNVAARKGYNNIVQLLSEEPDQNITTHSSTLPSTSAGINQTSKDTTSVDDVAVITEKLEELQSYLPQMSKMIDKMKASGPSNQLNKLSNLYKVILTKTTSISMSTLEKSHVVLKRMFPEDSSNTNSIKDKASTNATFAEIDQIYLQEAMEDGLVESFVTKAVVQGEARVGKSSVKSLLVSEPYTDNTSTNCIEPPCVAVKCYGQTGKYWERIDEEEMGIKVIAAVQLGAMKKSESQSHSEEMDLDSKSISNTRKQQSDPSCTAMQLSEREISVGQHSLSVIEILKHLLSAIASSAQRYRSLIADDPVLSKCITPPSDKLKVLPVATHHDEYKEALKNGKESIVNKKITINEIFCHHETCEIVGREGKIYLYEVDGRKARNKVFENLQPDSDLYKIAQALEDNAYQIKVPLKWYCFGVLLHDVAKEGCGVLSLSFCQKLGQQLKVNLSPEESLSAIKFLSFLNKLLFYPDSPAGDLVFVNIESLINILRDLLIFICDTHSEAKLLLPDQKALVCKGHLSIEILKKASKSSNKICEAFSDFDAKLLGLFEYLLIATKLPEKESFFMPALLPIKDVSDINPYPNTTPLLLYFENAIPMGLFCAVIVHLLSDKEAPWKFVEESNFSNYFTLRCPDLLESIIILVEQVDCIALYCEATDDYIPARDAVEKAVDVAMSKHKLSTCEKPKRAFYCPCGKGRHVAVVSWLKTQHRYVFRCTIDCKPKEMSYCLNWIDQINKGKRQHDELNNLPDVLETNFAYQVLVESTEEIKEYFSDDFSKIASKLLQMNLINETERSAITDRNTGWNKYQRMEELMERVEVAVKINKEPTFLLFLNILNEKGTQPAQEFARKLMERYKDKFSDAHLDPLSKRVKQYEN
uniref:Uncharacterized protein n=1 Tax=Amphimedon queenslandica TaxID=400682 RepID=A0A1X7TTV1_AMPQE